ncbi:MAG: DEAD/DEAH box helicase, partial [archaeon]
AALNIRKPHLAINASKLIEINKLTPCEINFIKVNNSNIEWQGNYHKTYNKSIVYNENRNNKIVDLAIQSVKNGRVPLILISKIKHGKILLNKIKEKMEKENIKIEDKLIPNEKNNWDCVSTVEFVHGNDDLLKRESVFKSVKEGFTKILIGSTIADEGLDLPILDTLILAGAGKSSTRAFQRVGRVLRLYDKKEKAIVYDFMDMQDTFYKQYLYRKALYKTEPLWKINHI